MAKDNPKKGLENSECMHNKIISNLFWRFAERSGAQIVTFIVSVVLARVLEAEIYGTVAIMAVFIAIVQVFVDSGLGNALIQKKDADDVDFSSVFYANIVLCLMMYLLLYICSPYIAEFYGDMSMVPMIRVLGITVIMSGAKNVQQAYVAKHLLFKKFFFSTLCGTICAGIVGIYMALNGYGAWALIVQQVINVSIDTIVVWMTVKWRPKRLFSWSRLKKLYSYGWKLLVSAMVDTIYNKLRELLIGKVYTKADLAFYERGQKIPELVVNNINSSIDSILLPVMSEKQDDKSRIKEMTRRAMQTSVYIMAPIMMGLAFSADTVIVVLLGSKWLFCVPYLRVFCITYMFYPVHTANLNAIKAMGRSDLFLKLEVLKKLIGIILLVATVRISVMAMTYVLLLSSVLSQIINAWPNKKLLGYGYLEQLSDILPSIICAIISGIFVWEIGRVEMNVYILLFVQVLICISVYLIGSIVFRFEPYNDIRRYFSKVD